MTGSAVATHLQAFSSLLAHDQEAAQLHMRDLQILSLLVSHGVPLSVSAVATIVGVSVPMISRAAEKLVQRGLLTRGVHVSDRRQVLLSPSDSGARLDARVKQHFHTARQLADEEVA